MRVPAGVVLAATLASGAASADAPAAGWSLDTLMTGMRGVPAASAHFVESKTIHLLTRPIQATGTLKYVAPDKLEKVTLTPAPETIRLDGANLTGTRAGGETFSIDIASHTEVAALVEGIRSTLAGDLPTLQRYYEISFTGQQAQWQINLMPKDHWVRQKVDRIRILGAGTAINNIMVDEKDGDRSEMAVTPDRP
jgi:hypothetical protein